MPQYISAMGRRGRGFFIYIFLWIPPVDLILHHRSGGGGKRETQGSFLPLTERPFVSGHSPGDPHTIDSLCSGQKYVSLFFPLDQTREYSSIFTL